MSQKLNSVIAVIGIDIGKNSFHLIGQNKRGAIVLRQKWSRGQVEARLANMQPCLIGMEACVGAHHLSRKLQALGHDARLGTLMGAPLLSGAGWCSSGSGPRTFAFETPPLHAAALAALPTKGLAMISSNRITCVGDHWRPCAAGMPRSSSAAAMARSDVQPLACSSLMVGARSSARLRACSWRAAVPSARCLAVSRAPRSPPSFTPRRLAAASAARVRSEMRRRSSSAITAMMPIVSRLAWGMSTATKSTPAFSRPSRKCASLGDGGSQKPAAEVFSCGKSLP